jgi:hypothetical protein
MSEVRKQNRPLADAATEAALWFVCDPMGWFCVLGAFGTSRKAGITVSGVFLAAWTFCTLLAWLKNIEAPVDRNDNPART